MSVLVTGGAGYIGSHIAYALADAGMDFAVIDDLSTGFSSALPKGAALYIGDVGDPNLVETVIDSHGIDAIVHLAGSVVVPDSLRNPLGYYANNTANTLKLLRSAVRKGVRQVIFSSTAAVYGNPDILPVTEEAPTRPLSPYGTSKLMSEIMLHDAANAHDLRFVVLRYFNVAGADPKGRTGLSTAGATHLLKVAVEAAIGRRDGLDVFGTDYPTPDGTCIRDFVHVSDLASAHLAALAYLRDGGGSATLNCGYGHGFSVNEVIAAVKQASGAEFAVRQAPRREGDIVSMVADTTRIRHVLDWTPQFDDIDLIAAHALDWERKLAGETETAPALAPASAMSA